MRINREDFLKELESVTPGLSTREIIEQSSCFIFKDKTVMTYNDEIACSHKSCLSIEGAVQALPLIAILRKLQEENLEVMCNEEELLIKGKRKRAGIRMEAEILLPVDSIEKPKKWKDLPDDFADSIQIVQQCAGRDETRFSLTCVHLTPKWVEACDGYQAARYKIKIDINENTLVRKESLKYIVSLDMTKFSETKNWIHFKNSSGLILSCRRWVEDYPELDDLLGVEGVPTSFPKGLKEAIEKAEVFSTENVEDNQVTVDLQVGKLRITGRGASGYYQEVKKIKYKGRPMSFSIAPNLLSDLIQRHNSCQIAKDKLKVDAGKDSYVTVLEIPDKK